MSICSTAVRNGIRHCTPNGVPGPRMSNRILMPIEKMENVIYLIVAKRSYWIAIYHSVGVRCLQPASG